MILNIFGEFWKSITDFFSEEGGGFTRLIYTGIAIVAVIISYCKFYFRANVRANHPLENVNYN